MSTTTFTLACSSGTNFYFPYPDWSNVDNAISKNVELLDFWTGELDTVDKGINSQPLILEGTICVGGEHWEGLCFPICPNAICFSNALSTFLDDLKMGMNNGETFTISELGDCVNGVYVIQSFTFDTIPRCPDCFTWRLTLERVRDV